MKSLCDEIRLRRKIRTDLTSSAKQISSEQSEDFIAKLQIALKECYETEYWIEIAKKQILYQLTLQKVFCTIVGQSAVFLFLPLLCSVWLLFRTKPSERKAQRASMISVPCGTGVMPSAYEGTDIISRLRSKHIISPQRYIIEIHVIV